jgi:hypothetical protein
MLVHGQSLLRSVSTAQPHLHVFAGVPGGTRRRAVQIPACTGIRVHKHELQFVHSMSLIMPRITSYTLITDSVLRWATCRKLIALVAGTSTATTIPHRQSHERVHIFIAALWGCCLLAHASRTSHRRGALGRSAATRDGRTAG